MNIHSARFIISFRCKRDLKELHCTANMHIPIILLMSQRVLVAEEILPLTRGSPEACSSVTTAVCSGEMNSVFSLVLEKIRITLNSW